MDLRFPGRCATRVALRRIEAVSGLTIVRGRVTAAGARLEVTKGGEAMRSKP